MPQGDLDGLRQRKKELLLESDINRQIMRVESAQLKIKAVEWRRGLLKVRTAYQWMAPLAGVGFAVYGMRKKILPGLGRGKLQHNGNGHGRKSAYMNLLGPIGAIALRKAFDFWKHSRKRDARA